MEETGLMVTLGRWIIEEVCRQIAVWQRLVRRHGQCQRQHVTP